ncbi:MAG: sugar phosphate isomerase/epimerase [Verrucomicrobia bacterium]|nr:sugar phosphate isomerase/epimerase [Verrucomicrobiota bacterium]
MKLALSGRLWESSKGYAITLPQFLDTAAELGYDGIELRYPMIPPAEKLEEIRAQVRRLKLTVVFSTCAGLIKDEKSREDALRVIRTVKTLDGLDVRATMTTDEDYGPMRELANLAAENRMRVAMQLHINTLCDTVERCEQCLKKLNHPNVKLIFDPVHLRFMGDNDFEPAIRRLARWVHRANVQNYALMTPMYSTRQKIPLCGKDWVRVLPGETGGTDFRAYFAALRQAGFDGWINVMCDVEPGMDSKTAAKLHHDFLRPLLA